ncbi:hypothetical protein BJX65DRAFT_309363 [Aspergillus insuetus]
MQSILHPIIGPKKTIEELTGRVAIITGGAFGIGYEISRAFVLNGARVIMINCKKDQGQDAIDKIKKESGSDANIKWLPCDMGNLAQIKDVAPKFVKDEERLDLLILSAGINVHQYGESTDTSSDNIYALSVQPGAVNTAMQQQWRDTYPGLLGKLLTTVMLAVGRDVEQGSYSALYAATSLEVEEKGWNGYYFADPGKPGKETSQVSDPELGRRLWDLSQNVIKEKLGDDALVHWGKASICWCMKRGLVGSWGIAVTSSWDCFN